MQKTIKSSFWRPVFAQLDLKHATIKLVDGSNSAKELTIKVGEGNLSYTEKRAIEYTLDRGLIDEVREGDQAPVDVKLSFTWVYLQAVAGTTIGSGTAGVSPVDPADAIKGTGTASDWTSSDPDDCRPFSVDIEITMDPDCGNTQKVITLPYFRYENLEYDLKAATISVDGKCNVREATVVNSG